MERFLRRVQDNLTGVWSGLYMYPEALEPCGFTATLMDVGGDLSGSTHERDVWEQTEKGLLFALLVGFRDGDAVSFRKTYDGTGGWSHTVYYLGDLSADGQEIEGTWTVRDAWSGRFLMVRDSNLLTAERREAFERA